MTMMIYSKILHIDLETFSSVDLAKCGLYKYAESEDFRILLFGYAYDNGPVKVIDVTKEDIPIPLRMDIADPKVLKVAHNANFERVCLSQYLCSKGHYLPPDQWADTMIMASEQGYPASLAQLGPALGLSEDETKLDTGRRLIQYFCKPCKPTKTNGGCTINRPKDAPDRWKLFIEYNRRDVIAERAIWDKLNRMTPIKPSEWAYWYIDQRINDRGIQIDMDMVSAIKSYGTHHSDDLMARAKLLTGLENPRSIVQLKGWIEEKEGHKVDTLRKSAIDDMLESDEIQPKTREMLELRKELGKTSVKKYDAFTRSVCLDGRVHGCFQFYGGRTGRWAGRLIQPQNFPKPKFDDLDTARNLVKDGNWEVLEMLYPSMNDVFSTLIRTAIIPKPGCAFAVADYSAIEARVIAWLTRETWRMKVFEKGGDIYCASASQMFGVPVVKHGVNGELRQKGKIAELALGYGGGIPAMKNFGADKLGMSEKEMQETVDRWRRSSPHIHKYWYTLGHAFESAIQGETVTLDRNMMCFRHGNQVYIRLPSGRNIAYVNPRIKDGHIEFDGLNQAHKWTTITTWGGKLTENVVQAIARDCLAETFYRCDRAGIPIVMHVHDEIICEVPAEQKEEIYKKILDIMATPIGWAPGLMLKGDGFTSSYYKKD